MHFVFHNVSLRCKNIERSGKKGPPLPTVSNLIHTFLTWCNCNIKNYYQQILNSAIHQGVIKKKE